MYIYIYTCINTYIYTCVCVYIYITYNGVLLIIRKSEILSQMDLENIMPTEINQTEEKQILYYLYVESKN